MAENVVISTGLSDSQLYLQAVANVGAPYDVTPSSGQSLPSANFSRIASSLSIRSSVRLRQSSVFASCLKRSVSACRKCGYQQAACQQMACRKFGVQGICRRYGRNLGGGGKRECRHASYTAFVYAATS